MASRYSGGHLECRTRSPATERSLVRTSLSGFFLLGEVLDDETGLVETSVVWLLLGFTGVSGSLFSKRRREEEVRVVDVVDAEE